MKKALLVLAIAAFAVPAMGAPLAFVENWDSHTVNEPPGSPWYDDSHYYNPSTSYAPWVDDAGAQRSAPYSVLINNAGFNGKDLGTQALLAGGQLVAATDASPLAVDYYVYSNVGAQRKNSDWIVEISLGDEHAPAYGTVLDTPIPVIAYGHPKTSALGTTMYYFNGLQWQGVGYHDIYGAWENVNYSVGTSSVALSSTNDGATSLARAYTGSFDRISIRSTEYTAGYWTSLDDLSVTGGDVPEPTTAILLLGLSGLFLRRRTR